MIDDDVLLPNIEKLANLEKMIEHTQSIDISTESYSNEDMQCYQAYAQLIIAQRLIYIDSSLRQLMQHHIDPLAAVQEQVRRHKGISL